VEIRFGFVAMSVTLEKASPSKTVTLKSYKKLAEKDEEAALHKVLRVSRENLANTLRLLKHCKFSGVKVYRFSSKLVPLATHPLLAGWDYIGDLQKEFSEIGDYVKESQMRVSFHPDHYTLINSPREDVLDSSIKDLEHHHDMLEAMGLDSRAKLVTHVGGGYRDKEKALERFRENWDKVPETIRERLVLENDDRTYTASQVLKLCEKLNIPMVLDIHHHRCNNNGEEIEEFLAPVFATWEGTGLPPKIHISSPKSPTDIRSHHDFVDPADLFGILSLAVRHTDCLDVMVEAKQKDKAMFELVKGLTDFPGVTQVTPGILELNAD
jgi:UV DNA damage endonuclease